MPDIPAIAPNAAAFRAAGGITTELVGGGPRGIVRCGLCGEWDEVTDWRQWAREHELGHDALRPSVLGIDPSLRRAGVAVISQYPDGGAWPSLVTHRGEDGHENATYAERGRRLVRQARAIVGRVDAAITGGADIRLAAIEGPAYGMTSGHAFDRAGVWWSVYAALMSRGIPIAVVTPAHREKFIAGVSLRPNARTGLTTAAAKQRIVDETKARWAFPNGPVVLLDAMARLNHDQADALGLADMAAVQLKLDVPWRLRRRHVENVALVDWPEAT